jgi:threonine aldolase
LPEPITLRPASRLIVHIQTTEEAVDDLLALFRKIAQEKKDAGFAPPEKKVNGAVGNVYGTRN